MKEVFHFSVDTRSSLKHITTLKVKYSLSTLKYKAISHIWHVIQYLSLLSMNKFSTLVKR
jgi:hypothetical protein